MSEDELVDQINALPAWKSSGDFSEEEWACYLEVGRRLQEQPAEVIERALDRVVNAADTDSPAGDESQSKAFLLLRLVFDLPQRARVEERRSFKGWINWPKSDAEGFVSLAWPVAWVNGRPSLCAPYGGSMGLPYDASGEYRYLRGKYQLKEL